MLVLSRKVGDKLRIGEQVEVEVLQVRGNRVRLGVVAPAEVRIARGELLPLPAPLDRVTIRKLKIITAA